MSKMGEDLGLYSKPEVRMFKCTKCGCPFFSFDIGMISWDGTRVRDIRKNVLMALCIGCRRLYRVSMEPGPREGLLTKEWDPRD